MAIFYEQLQQLKSDPGVAANGRSARKRKASLKSSAKKTEGKVAEEYGDRQEEFESPFEIEVRFLGGLSDSQEQIFEQAAARWAQIIVSDLPPVALPDGEVVENLVIDAQGVSIDGDGGILGRAGPRFLRPDNLLPATGVMQFDTADLANMEVNGSLLDVIIHEMGHVIGLGTLWQDKNLVLGCSVPALANPVFLGPLAIEEFAALNDGIERPVPVANQGGPGTRCGHWRESVFGAELMTGFINNGPNPISRLTIASLEDLGYEVNYSAADDYHLPNALELAIMGVGSDGHSQTCRMCGGGVNPIVPVVLPESSLDV